MTVFEIIGWIGAFLFITAYFLLSINVLKADKIPYQLMNVLGGLSLVINSIDLKDYPNFVTNIIWMGIGIFAIFNIFRKKTKVINQTIKK